MAEKCAVCREKIEVTFLEKIRGTYVKGKAVCFKCQKKLKDEIVKRVSEK